MLGGEMIKLHATRLMRAGEVVLWSEGAIVWSGIVGAYVSNVAFDAVSMHVDDSAQMAARLPVAATADEVLAALAGWWA
jgi:hypothetical protein